MRATMSPPPVSNHPGTGSSPCSIAMSVSSQVADPIEVERAHRLPQMAPALQVPLARRDEHLHRVDRARRGCGIRRLVRERDGDAPLQRLGDRVAHGVDRSGREDDVGRGAGGAAGELGEKSCEQLGVADSGDRPSHLQTRQQRGGLARRQFRRALQTHGVRDDDDVALVQQVPVDVEQVVRHLPVAAVAGKPDHREGLDHGAHLIGGHVELVGGFGDRDLALADQVGHELQHERRAIGGDERLAGDHAAPPWAARAASRRAITCVAQLARARRRAPPDRTRPVRRRTRGCRRTARGSPDRRAARAG